MTEKRDYLYTASCAYSACRRLTRSVSLPDELKDTEYRISSDRYSKRQGELIIIIGPMFSGKSTELYHRINSEIRIGKRVLVMSPKKDTHNIDSVGTHDRLKLEALKIGDDLLEYTNLARLFDVIGLDEVHFLKNTLVFCRTLVEKHGKTVIASGLNLTYTDVPWDEMSVLIPYATKCKLKRSICKDCGAKNAIFNHRLSKSTKLIEPGESNYIPICSICRDKRHADNEFLVEFDKSLTKSE